MELQRQIRDRFGDCCAYCQTAEFLTAMRFEFDHIQPLSAGGKRTFENLCFACPSCNRHKSDRQVANDPINAEVVPLFHPQQQSWNDHFAWSDSKIEIIGKTAIGRATIPVLQMNRPALVHARSLWVKLGEHPPSLDER